MKEALPKTDACVNTADMTGYLMTSSMYLRDAKHGPIPLTNMVFWLSDHTP